VNTQSIAVKSFALSAAEGRTQQPLNILDAEMLAKLRNDNTNDTVAISLQNVPPISGPQLHRRSPEGEWFYLLDGQITIEVDGQQTILRAGGSAFAVRGIIHTFQKFGPAPARHLVMVTPGVFPRFCEELTLLNRGLAAPDLVRVEKLMNKYGVELLRPPLS
jgi:quercetin dioxygenase-like cupin family protein